LMLDARIAVCALPSVINGSASVPGLESLPLGET